MHPSVSAAAAATELLGRVQASLTAGFNASAAQWPGASAPVMPLPASAVGLLLAAPAAAAKALNPLAPVPSDPQAQLAGAGFGDQQPQLMTSTMVAAGPVAVPGADETAGVELASGKLQQ